MDEILEEFLNEASEHVDRFELDLARLAAEPSDAVALEEAYRSLHTVKGAAGFLALSQVEALTAAGELLLGRAQKGEIVVTPERHAALVELGRRLRGLLEGIRDTGGEELAEDNELVERLGRLAVR